MALLDLIDSINGFDCDYETQKGGFQTKNVSRPGPEIRVTTAKPRVVMPYLLP